MNIWRIINSGNPLKSLEGQDSGISNGNDCVGKAPIVHINAKSGTLGTMVCSTIFFISFIIYVCA